MSMLSNMGQSHEAFQVEMRGMGFHIGRDGARPSRFGRRGLRPSRNFDIGVGKRPFAEPEGEEAIEDRIFDEAAFVAEDAEVRLMVELRGGVGIARRSSSDDGIRDAHCRADL